MAWKNRDTMKYIYIYIFLPSEKIFVCLFVPTQRCKYRSVNHSQGAIFPNFSGKIRLVDYRRGEAWRRPVIVSTASNPRSSRPLSLSLSLCNHDCALDPFLLPLSKRESNAGGNIPADAAIATSPFAFPFSFPGPWMPGHRKGRNRGK